MNGGRSRRAYSIKYVITKKFELGDLSKILKLVPEKRQEGENILEQRKMVIIHY